MVTFLKKQLSTLQMKTFKSHSADSLEWHILNLSSKNTQKYQGKLVNFIYIILLIYLNSVYTQLPKW